MIDLTDAYAPASVKRIMRGVALLNRRDVLVQDEIQLKFKREVAWSMHTRAKITIDGRTATLKQGGKTMMARLLYPPGVKFTTEPAAAPRGQAQQPDVTKLMVRFTPTEPTHIAVLFTSGTEEPAIPRLTPVSTWPDQLPVKRR